VSHAPRIDSSDDLYRQDSFAWSKREVELLRQRRFSEIDLENIIEEIETVGRSEWRSLKSSYRVLVQHLLKWQFQPERRSRSWADTIRNQRTNIASDEEDSHALAAEAGEIVARAYRLARRHAASETGLPLTTFPPECPYTLEQLRDLDYFPE